MLYLGTQHADDVLQVSDRTRQPINPGDDQCVALTQEVQNRCELGATPSKSAPVPLRRSGFVQYAQQMAAHESAHLKLEWVWSACAPRMLAASRVACA